MCIIIINVTLNMYFRRGVAKIIGTWPRTLEILPWIDRLFKIIEFFVRLCHRSSKTHMPSFTNLIVSTHAFIPSFALEKDVWGLSITLPLEIDRVYYIHTYTYLRATRVISFKSLMHSSTVRYTRFNPFFIPWPHDRQWEVQRLIHILHAYRIRLCFVYDSAE